MEFLGLGLFVAWLIYAIRRDRKKENSNPLICKTCGSSESVSKSTPGSFLIEIILWICFIVPGLIYTIWRKSAKYKKCSICGSKELVPLNSPIGQRLQNEFQLSEVK